jgi:hypothetical protein
MKHGSGDDTVGFEPGMSRKRPGTSQLWIESWMAPQVASMMRPCPMVD